MSDTSLAIAAAQRKDRLLALKKRKAGEPEAINQEADGGVVSKPFSFKPRNFDPSTRQAARRPRTLANGSVVYEEGEEEDEGVVGKKGDTVEDKVKGLAEKIVRDDERKREEELDLLNIAPKRANWDLKRDMEKRTRKLERQTRESYAFLFRQRLQSLKSSSTAPLTNGSSKGADLLAGMQAAQNENDEMVARDERERGDEDDEE